jgi:hypothetical protein
MKLAITILNIFIFTFITYSQTAKPTYFGAKIGYNNSMSHSDFMFGNKDLSVIGVTKDGKKVVVFKDGNFVI